MEPSQVAGIVGFVGPPSGTTVAEWVAKARQESSFDPKAKNGTHYGLWQISQQHEGIVFSPKGAKFPAWCYDPSNNFKAARELFEQAKRSRGDGWLPWAASGGKPTPTKEDEASAEGGNWSDPLEDAVGLVTDPLEKIVELATAGYEWISDRKNIGRVALTLIGGIVVVGALITLAKPAVVNAKEGIV